MTTPLLIIDYGMGNLRSVANAFAAIGCEAVISQRPADLAGAERIVLPGVGAFGDAMKNIRAVGWDEALENEVRRKGKPFLGLCLGIQLLATRGTESGDIAGLGWIPGVVEKLQTDSTATPPIRVPHVGWNDVEFHKGTRLFAGLGDSKPFYFVHSFVVHPENASVTSGSCSYGTTFTAAIEEGNIHATQFHPEKSQKAGLAVLRNFLALG